MSDPFLSRVRPNVPSEVSQDQNTEATESIKGGQPEISDSVENAVDGTSALREAYQSAKSEGKMLMSQGTLNHFLQNNMTPAQYPEAFQDLKGWVNNNFHLNSDQQVTLNALSDENVSKVQDAGKQASDLNVPLTIEYNPTEPDSGPRDINFSKAEVTENAVRLSGDCGAASLPPVDLQNLGEFEP